MLHKNIRPSLLMAAVAGSLCGPRFHFAPDGAVATPPKPKSTMTVKQYAALLGPMTAAERTVAAKALCSVDGMQIVGDDGAPVEVETIELGSAAKAKADDPPVDPPVDDPMAATKMTEETISRLVTKALADARTKGGAARIVKAVDVTVEGAFRIPAEVKRHRVKNFKGVVNGKAADERAYRFGMYCLALLAKHIPSHYAFQKATDFTNEHITKLNSEGVNTAGGFLVPEEFSTDIIDLKELYGVVRKVFEMYPMSSDTLLIPRRTGGLTAYFVQEGAAGTESTAAWDQVRLTAKDLMVLTRMTNQVSEDAVINLGDKLAYEIAYAMSNKEDDCGFNGDGTSTYGGITGIRPALNNVAGNAGIQAQGTSNTWSALVLGDFDGVVGKLPQYADTPSAAWVCHRTFYYTVIEKLVQASGGVPAYEVREGERKPRPLFKGYPVEFSQVFPSTTAVATIPIILGDIGLGAAFGDRSQDSVEFSKEATIGGQSLWERNEIGVKGGERFDINVHDVGSSTAAGPIVALKTGA